MQAMVVKRKKLRKIQEIRRERALRMVLCGCSTDWSAVWITVAWISGVIAAIVIGEVRT